MFSRYWHTVKYLKPVQIYYRIWFIYTRPRSPSELGRGFNFPITEWVHPAEKSPSLLSESVFNLLNEAGDLNIVGWEGDDRSKLWRYNQHYFDDLCSTNASLRRAWHSELMRVWVAENPPGVGTGWEPYPLSLRITNWCKYFLSGEPAQSIHILSLAHQAEWLSKRIEHHLQGNHLFSNAKALYFAGCCIDTKSSKKWLKVARGLITRELNQQILADGGHFELSPMYHALMLEDLLDLINVSGAYGHFDDRSHWSQFVNPMICWLQKMSHPDGSISFFNDSALAVACSNEKLYEYSHRLGFVTPEYVNQLCNLFASGFVRMQTENITLFCDVGRVGPDHIPGHAHADTLSFELSYKSNRIFVNSGTSEYGLGPERLRQRSTAAHNTVVINGENSSEVWGGFRVARRAYPMNVRMAIEDDASVLTAAHSGYHRLVGSPTHKRTWSLHESTLTIEDFIDGQYESSRAYYHCHPEVNVERSKKVTNELVLLSEETPIATLRVVGASLSVEQSTWHPEFGASIENKMIVLNFQSPFCVVTVDFSSTE